MNRLTPVMKQSKRKIIKQHAGEMGHIDAHYLSKSIVKGEIRKRYLVCIVDDCTRLAWAKIVYDIKSITVMFAALKCLNILDRYDVRFEEMLSDNGPEFGPRVNKQKEHHPFERLLIELNIKHRYTRPYRPQTNGKVERFWRTIEDDMLSDTYYDNDEELKEELLQYMYYYNEIRHNQGINDIPVNFRKSLPN